MLVEILKSYKNNYPITIYNLSTQQCNYLCFFENIDQIINMRLLIDNKLKTMFNNLLNCLFIKLIKF